MFVLHYQLLSPKAQMASQTQVAVECDLGDADREKEALDHGVVVDQCANRTKRPMSQDAESTVLRSLLSGEKEGMDRKRDSTQRQSKVLNHDVSGEKLVPTVAPVPMLAGLPMEPVLILRLACLLVK